MAALPVWSNPVFVRTAQPEAIPNMFPANVPLLSRKVAKSHFAAKRRAKVSCNSKNARE